MLTNTAAVLTGLFGVAIVLMGVRIFWAPQTAVHFGIPDTPTEDRSFQSWLKVKGVRDMACGLFILVLLAGASRPLLGWFLLTATWIPIGDALIVRHSKGPGAAVYGIHGATAVVMLAVSFLLIAA